MYVLANCDLGRTEEIASELRKIDQVQEVHMINGVYDIILKMSGPTKVLCNHDIGKLDHAGDLKQIVVESLELLYYIFQQLCQTAASHYIFAVRPLLLVLRF